MLRLRAFMRMPSILFTSVAYACPLCHTPVGEQVRIGIFNTRFGTNLLATVLPFPIFAVIVVCIYRSKPKPSGAVPDEKQK